MVIRKERISATTEMADTAVPDVAFYVHSLEGGGAERVLVNLANQLAAGGAKIDIVLVSKHGPYLPMVSEQVRIVDLQGRGSLSSSPALANYLKEERPKTLVACMENACIAAALAGALARTSTKIFMWEHITPSAHYAHTQKLKEKFLPPFCRVAYKRAEKVIAVSEGCATDVAKTYRVPSGKVVTIPNPIRVDEIRAMAKEPSDHPWVGDPTRPLLLGAGRLTEQKDFPNMLRALAEVRKSVDARLVILGEGPLEESLKTLTAELGVQDVVDFPGYLKNPFALMARCDLFVLSSLYEALPTVLIEAILCGAHVVSTDCPSGPDEILFGGRHGVLVETGSASALAKGILESLTNPRPALPEEKITGFRSENIAMRFRRLLLGDSD